MEDVRRQEVRELARLTAHLDAAQQVFFQSEYSRHRRNPTTALLLCALLGDFGAHYFYFGRHRAGMLRLLFCWTLIPGIVALFEARTIEARATRYNASLANELLLAVRSTVEGGLEPVRALDGAFAVPALAPADASDLASAEAGQHIVEDGIAARVPPARVHVTAGDILGTAVGDTDEAPGADLATGNLRDGDTRDGGAQAREGAPRAAGWTANDGDDHSAEDRLIAAAWLGRDPADYAPALAHDTPAVDAMSDAGIGEYATPTGTAKADAYWLPDEDTSAADDKATQVGTDPSEDPDASWLLDNPALAVPVATNTWDEEDDLATPDAANPPDAAPSDWSASERAQSTQWGSDESPAIAAAAVSAAAAWARPQAVSPSFDPEQPDEAATHFLARSWPFGENQPADGQSLAPEGEDQSEPEPLAAAGNEREPVFMYQVAPPPSREAVHFAPPAAKTPFEWPHTADYAAAVDRAPDGRSANTQNPTAHASAAPSAPYAGHVGEDIAFATLGTALAGGLVDILRDRPARRSTARSTVPLENASQSRGPGSGDPRIVVASVPHVDSEPLADLAWLPAEPSAPPVALDAPGTQAAEGARPLIAAESARIAPPSAPLDTAPPMPQNVRRRLVQRVIVRKLAMLEGQVVAESTVERQVPVLSDDQAMAAQVQTATLEAAREALTRLIREAPEETLPAIRMELYALDNRAYAQSVRRPGS